MKPPVATAPTDSLLLEKRVTRFVLRAGLFWQNGPIVQAFVTEDGIFYWHGALSAGEQFFEFLQSVGVFLLDDRGRYRLAIQLAAVELYADYLIDKGLKIESVIDALVCVGGESWLETSRDPFPAKFYDNYGTISFDCRQLMADMACLGYAERRGNLYIWTSKMEPILKANLF